MKLFKYEESAGECVFECIFFLFYSSPREWIDEMGRWPPEVDEEDGWVIDLPQ